MAETKKKTTRKKAEATPAPAQAQAPGGQRATRKVRVGIVSSNKMQKTVVVQIERRIQHALYGKVVTRLRKFKAHDEVGCDIGDRVEIMETRPLSAEKCWRVTRILEKVK